MQVSIMYKLVVNVKAYKEATGEKAIQIAKACKELENEAYSKGIEIIMVPTFFDMKDCCREGVKAFGQHVDELDYGSYTGHVIAKELSSVGAQGTLINHSEYVLEYSQIKDRIEAAKDAGLESCVCARENQRAEEIAKLSPTYVAVEPRELIGGDISISKARPELIDESLDAVGEVPLLVGAGIKTSEDIKIAVEKGVSGVLVASGVAKSNDPKEAIRELIKGFE